MANTSNKRDEYAHIYLMNQALQAVCAAITVLESGDNVLEAAYLLREAYERRDNLIRVLTDEVGRQFDRRVAR